MVTVLCAGQSGVRISGRARYILSLVRFAQTGCWAHLPCAGDELIAILLVLRYETCIVNVNICH
jgi:hypothetical protein